MSLQQSEARREKLREERAEARRLGVRVTRRVTVDKGWTEAEDDTVRRLYPDYTALVQVLRHRTYASIKIRARSFQIVKPKHIWTTIENKRLCELWSKSTTAELRAAFPEMTRHAIMQHGYFLGLPHRGKVPLKITGNWLCDAIRDRSMVLGYTLVQLDAMARTGKYFQESRWLNKPGHQWHPMGKAAMMLGGELRVEWPD